jgi:hypothetical protein
MAPAKSVSSKRLNEKLTAKKLRADSIPTAAESILIIDTFSPVLSLRQLIGNFIYAIADMKNAVA